MIECVTIPRFEFLNMAIASGYIKQKIYYNDGIEMETLIIVKPFYFKLGRTWELQDEIGEPVYFGAWHITDKGIKERKRRELSAYLKDYIFWNKVEREEKRNLK